MLLYLLAVLTLSGFSEVETPEDKARLTLFNEITQRAASVQPSDQSIPKTFHFIWLGPKPFPPHSLSNLKGWLDEHPGWKAKFWTDQIRLAPDPRVEVMAVGHFPLGDFADLYFDSDNEGERSELLRYLILFQEGGVYVDHDMRCTQPLDPIQREYDLFCGLEPEKTSILSSSVNAGTHLIGARAGHPVLKGALEWLNAHWSRVGTQFPGHDANAVYNRVKHRTFKAFTEGLLHAGLSSSYRNAVFPPEYFNTAEQSVYASHGHEGAWVRQEEIERRKTDEMFKAVEKRLTYTLILLGVSIGVGMCLLVSIWKKRLQ